MPPAPAGPTVLPAPAAPPASPSGGSPRSSTVTVIQLTLSAPTAAQWGLFAATLAAGMLAALLPGVRAYRLSLADGLSPPT